MYVNMRYHTQNQTDTGELLVSTPCAEKFTARTLNINKSATLTGGSSHAHI
jgi:hypothetical protein